MNDSYCSNFICIKKTKISEPTGDFPLEAVQEKVFWDPDYFLDSWQGHGPMWSPSKTTGGWSTTLHHTDSGPAQGLTSLLGGVDKQGPCDHPSVV